MVQPRAHRKARCGRAERAQDAREDRADRQWHGVRRFTKEQNRAERLATPPLWHAEAVGGRPHGVIAGASRPIVPTVSEPAWSRRLLFRSCSSDHDGVARPSRDRAGLGAGDRRMKMAASVGLDVSMKETAVSIRRDGKRIWRGKCGSDPRLIAAVIRRRASRAARVVFETGPLSVWFSHALTAEGLPAICIDARPAKAALDMAPNKTDANDADGLAQLAEVGFFR